MMYGKDKTESITLRLSKKQMDYLNSLSKITGISRVELLRGYIDRLMGSQSLANK